MLFYIHKLKMLIKLSILLTILPIIIIVESTKIVNKTENENIYFLISTSTKIYCLKEKFNANQQDSISSNYDILTDSSSHLNSDYEIIYEELNSTNNWITDIYYDSVDNTIYVNIYDSIGLKSDIIRLQFDKKLKKWVKYYLFRNQHHCLGIAYDAKKRELFWSAGKAIMSGKIPKNTEIDQGKHQIILHETPRVLFNLELTKKLLYLKYDQVNNAVFVSSLNNIYVCFMEKESCHVLIQNMQSARGIYLDNENHYLYTVDHKRKQIDRMKIVSNLVEKFYPSETTDMSKFDEMKLSSILNNNILPDIGDVFYVCFYKEFLLWTEFSGKLKSFSLESNSNHNILFTTNEYTYAIVLMNNSTSLDETINKNITVSQEISLSDVSNSDNFESYDYIDLVSLEQRKDKHSTNEKLFISKSTLLIKLSTTTTETNPITSTIINNFVTSPVIMTTPTTTTTITTSTIYFSTTITTSTIYFSTVIETSTISTSNTLPTSKVITTETEYITPEIILTTYATTKSLSETLSSIEITRSHENIENKSSSEEIEDNEDLDAKFKELLSHQTSEVIDIERETETTTPVVFINLKKQKVQASNEKLDTVKFTPLQESSSKTFSSSSPSATFSIVLYIISSLLCLSVIINAGFFYFTRIKRTRGKLILNHDLSDSSEQQNMKSDEIADTS